MPVFFAGQINNYEIILDSIFAFISFTFVTSAVYIFNDYCDLKIDQNHPEKKFRPLASGDVKIITAFSYLVFLLMIGVSLMYFISIQSLYILMIYIFLNIFYSIFLKNFSILDVVIISIGFVLRLFIGSSSSEIYLSNWIVIMTFLLALFLSLAKRRNDVLIYNNTGSQTRSATEGYNLKFIDSSMSILSSAIIVSYIIYITSISHHSEFFYFTTLFVILGVIRYLQISLVEEKSGDPTSVALKDRFIQITIIFWLCSYGWLLYF